MTYFFTDAERAGRVPRRCPPRSGGAGRKLPLLPPVERGVYAVQNKAAAPRVKVGADVLPWWPIRGVYLLLETGTTSPTDLIDVDGVAGVWSAARTGRRRRDWRARQPGQQLTYCFLDDDPVGDGGAAAARAREALDAAGVEPLLAAPFHPVVPYEWDRYVP